MGLNIVDKTGTPRSDEDLQEAIDTMVRQLASRNMDNPQLTVMIPTILECLQELQSMRRVIREHQNRKGD